MSLFSTYATKENLMLKFLPEVQGQHFETEALVRLMLFLYETYWNKVQHTMAPYIKNTENWTISYLLWLNT